MYLAVVSKQKKWYVVWNTNRNIVTEAKENFHAKAKVVITVRFSTLTALPFQIRSDTTEFRNV